MPGVSVAPPGPLELTVLGSGGPIANPRRASTSYAMSVAGRTRLLVDAGGGAFVRLGQAGINPAGIDAVLLTHTHADHSGGLPSLVFAAYMGGRSTPLALVGPAGHDMHPGPRAFADLLFGPAGAWSDLTTFPGFGVAVHEVPSDPADARVHEVDLGDDVRVRAVAVPHGMMPAVAYRIDAGGRSACFSGDVGGAHPPLAELARECDLLVHHQAVPAHPTPEDALHAKPADTGATARAAGARAVLLSHFMPEADAERETVVAEVAEAFGGPVRAAEDLMRVAVGAPASAVTERSSDWRAS